MNQGIQDTLNNPVIRNSGCYFLCLLRWAELESNREFNEANINWIFNQCRKDGAINSECLVLVPHAILNTALQEDKYSSIQWPFPTVVAEDTRAIEFLRKPNYTHFRLRDGNVTWDPLNPERLSAASYNVESYRIIV